MLLFTSDTVSLVKTLGLYLIGAAFSAIHLGAWNWQFPSTLIQHLWRIFGAISVGSALVCISLVLVRRVDAEKVFKKRHDTTFNIAVAVVFFLLSIPYAGSRLVLIVLTFYCFTSMPAFLKVIPNSNSQGTNTGKEQPEMPQLLTQGYTPLRLGHQSTRQY